MPVNTWTRNVRNASPPKHPAQLSVHGTCFLVTFSSMSGVRLNRSSSQPCTAVIMRRNVGSLGDNQHPVAQLELDPLERCADRTADDVALG